MKREPRQAKAVFQETEYLTKSKNTPQALSEITEIAPVTFYFTGHPDAVTFEKVSIRSLKTAAWRSLKYDNNSCVTIWDGDNHEWLVNYDNVCMADIHHQGKSYGKSE